MYKLHTKGKRGNYVRGFALLVLFGIFLVACEKEQNTVDPRDKVVDTWKCSETGSYSGKSVYYVDITKASSDSTQIWIDNFYNLRGFKVYAKISGLKLTIPSQTVDGNVISGSGTIALDYKTISWSYSVNLQTVTDVVTAVYSRVE